MARLVVWLVLGVIAYALIRGWSRPAVGRRPPGAASSEKIVSCAACGLNVPQSEAHSRDGKWYCSREHLEQARPGGRDA